VEKEERVTEKRTQNFVRKLEGKSPFRRSRSRWDNFKEKGHESVDLIHVACYRDRWPAMCWEHDTGSITGDEFRDQLSY
jgi:hypothetical protein